MAAANAPGSHRPTVTIALNGRAFFFALAGLIGLVLLFSCSRRADSYIPREIVWRAIQSEAPRYGLDPVFVFNIAFAESSLNAHADTGYARGLMQISRAVWTDRTDRPYEQAYNWRINLQIGMEHLAYLKSRLELRKRYTPARLAAAYHRGLTALIQVKYDVSKLPQTPNEIYKELFANRLRLPSEFGL